MNFRVVPSKKRCHPRMKHGSPCGALYVTKDGTEYQADWCACGCSVLDWCMEPQLGWRTRA